MRNFKRIFALILCIVLVAAVALFASGCKLPPEETPRVTEKGENEGDSSDAAPENTEVSDGSAVTVGEGEKHFTFTVTDGEGKQTVFFVNTDKTFVGEALIELELIKGEDGPYGLYVKQVNGITADYDKDKTYWAFFADGEYSMTGVDKTEIENGKEYSFKIEK